MTTADWYWLVSETASFFMLLGLCTGVAACVLWGLLCRLADHPPAEDRTTHMHAAGVRLGGEGRGLPALPLPTQKGN